jgi:predicted transcriptional regulator of viral defense system
MWNESDNRGGESADLRIARLAAEEWSVLSLEELRRCGLSTGMVATRVRRGQLHRLHQGVYAVGHTEVPLGGRFLAAVKACGVGAVLSHFAAGALWEMVEWDERHIEVTVKDTTPRVHAGIRIHRSLFLDAMDVRRHRDVPVTSPARTALDLCSLLPERVARRAVRQAISNQWLSVRQLLEILERQARRPGARRLRGIVADGAVPTRSELEDAVLDVILSAGLGWPDVNVPMTLEGRRVVPDFRWPERKLIVEADSRKWHDNKLARGEDAERQALLEAHGERVIRVTWQQAVSNPGQTKRRVRAAAGH